MINLNCEECGRKQQIESAETHHIVVGACLDCYKKAISYCKVPGHRTPEYKEGGVIEAIVELKGMIENMEYELIEEYPDDK